MPALRWAHLECWSSCCPKSKFSCSLFPEHKTCITIWYFTYCAIQSLQVRIWETREQSLYQRAHTVAKSTTGQPHMRIGFAVLIKDSKKTSCCGTAGGRWTYQKSAWETWQQVYQSDQNGGRRQVKNLQSKGIPPSVASLLRLEFHASYVR